MLILVASDSSTSATRKYNYDNTHSTLCFCFAPAVVERPTTADLPSSVASSSSVVVPTSTSGTILPSSGEACLDHVTTE